MIEQLNATDERYQKKIDEAVERRAKAVRDEREATNEISALCVDARREGVTMAQLASWIKILPKNSDDLRPITRQAVDAMVAYHEGRERAPRKPAKSRREKSAIKLDAFS